jgi:hypothetical protein
MEKIIRRLRREGRGIKAKRKKLTLAFKTCLRGQHLALAF